MYRVIQWATGDLGAKAVAGIVGHPDLALVGAWVHSEEKEGKDVGSLCGMEPVGVMATRDKDALLDMPADCVSYMTTRTWVQDPMATVEELARILRAGKNVVNTAWPALVYPQALGDGIYETLQEACLAGGTSLYTGGIDPGYGSAGLALTALDVTRKVNRVRMYEILNYATWDRPEMVTLMGFGQPDVDKCPLLVPGTTARIFVSTLTLVADAMGVQLDDVVEDHEVVYADEAFDVAATKIPKGTICGMRFEVKGMVGGQARVIVEHVTRLRDKDFPDVDFVGYGYRAEVDGDPPIRVDMTMLAEDNLHAAQIACVMDVINAIPKVCDAPPGVVSMLDVLPHPCKNVAG